MLSSLQAPSCRLPIAGGKEPRNEFSNLRCWRRQGAAAAASLTPRRFERFNPSASTATAVVAAAAAASTSSSSTSSSNPASSRVWRSRQRAVAASLTRRRAEERFNFSMIKPTAVVAAAAASTSSDSSSALPTPPPTPPPPSSPWLCPACSSPLSPSDDSNKTLSCPQRHSYDVAREGYVNLVRAGRKAKKTGAAPAGDAPEALAARGRFFAAGHFDKVMDAAADAVLEVLNRRGEGRDRKTITTILDAGCGEGAYLRRLARRLTASPSSPLSSSSSSSSSSSISPSISSSSISLVGVDVAKAAVRSAASQAQREEKENHREGDKVRSHFAVASAFALPLAGNSVSAALVAFAPLPSAELRRVLRAGGDDGEDSSAAVVLVGPGPEHFLGLKRAVYGPERASERRMDSSSGSGSGGGGSSGDDLFYSSAALPPFSSQARVRYRLSLDGPAASDLLRMTPYWWKASDEVKEEVRERGLEDVEVDVLVSTVEREELDLL